RTRPDVEAQGARSPGRLLERVDLRDPVVRVAVEGGRHDDVLGQEDLDSALPGLLEVPADRVELVLLDEARADRVPLRPEEREDHPTADHEDVRALEEAVDDA